jgi:inosine/xanthosine triphosphate pyrophosphatase family protein
VPEYGATMAALPPEVKNTISHRARAVQAALPYLIELQGPLYPTAPNPGL